MKEGEWGLKVVGASSGIGKELARVLSNKGYIVGLVVRRKEKLLELQKQLSNKSFIKCIDISQPTAKSLLEEFINEMEGLDLIIISSGIGHLNPDLILDFEKETIDVNVSEFAVVSNIAFKHFKSIGSGHIVGISSRGYILKLV